MASLSRDDRDLGPDLWVELVARVLGVLAAFALALLGLALLFPAGGVADHLPAVPLGQFEPQRPLIGMLCFALAGIVVTAVMLRWGPEPRGELRAPLSGHMNLAAAPPEAKTDLAPFPAAETPAAPAAPAVASAAQPVEVFEREFVFRDADEGALAFAPPTPPAEAEQEAQEEAQAIALPPPPQMESAPDVIETPSQPVLPPHQALEHAPPEEVWNTPEPEAPPAAPLEPHHAQSHPVAEEVWNSPAETPSEGGSLVALAAAEPVVAPSAPAADAFERRRDELKAAFHRAGLLAAELAHNAKTDQEKALAAQDMGDIAAASGGHDQAADAYDRALVHARALSEAHPGSLPVKTVLADVLVKVGDLAAARGRYGAAIDAFQEAADRRREVARVSATEKPRLALGRALEKLAGAREALGDTKRAQALYEESLSHLGPLVASDTSYADLVYNARTRLAGLKTKA